MSDGQTGYGTTLTGATAGLIGNITQLTGPSETRDPIDISTMDSADQVREFIAGMKDSGEITFTCNYDGSAAGAANALKTAYDLGTAEIWTIVYPDTSTEAATGFITALGKATPFDDKITQDVTIKLTAKVTYTDVA